jgi:hypothetical protein
LNDGRWLIASVYHAALSADYRTVTCLIGTKNNEHGRKWQVRDPQLAIFTTVSIFV